MMMKMVLSLFATAFLLATGALAQTAPAPAATYQKMEFFQTFAGPPEGEINFLFAEFVNHGDPIKGAPYTATAVSENTQVLADGNRIVRKTSTVLARDSEGRVRREQTIASVGPLPVAGSKAIFISDPVSKTDYFLNPDAQTARVMKVERNMSPGAPGMEMKRKILDKASAAHSEEAPKSESLGTQVIEGVSCEGHRTTITIPAGKVGNERPIETTVESWFSSELHALVLSKSNDPRSGEHVYRLTDIKRGEPDASLFQVPAGYTTEKSLPRMPLPPVLPKD